ncbi:hypothetical protein SRRS_15080 [Sporomusa rhizae]|uniref:hypothetical protein n=1 Tax=Sporomusa rhizae TaxID=357999 RepID=UPI003529F3D4
MSAYDEAVNLLKQMHSIICKNNLRSYNISRDTFMALDNNVRTELERNIKFMREEGWIVPFTICSGLPVSYTLTSQGIKVAEDIVQNQVIQHTNYNIGVANNSIVGDNAHDNIINIGISFDELKSLIEQNFPDQFVRNEILDVIKSLQDKMTSNQPLEKGFLSKINDKFESCSWLSSGVASLVLQYLSTLAKG